MILNLAKIFGPEVDDGNPDRASKVVAVEMVDSTEASPLDRSPEQDNGAKMLSSLFNDPIVDLVADSVPTALPALSINPLELDCPDSDGLADPFDNEAFPATQPDGLCSPLDKPREPDRLSRVLTACDRCGSPDYRDVPIHGGRSFRRDCAACNRFLSWPKWYGRTLVQKN